MERQKTFSKEYLKMNKSLHKAPNGFGGGGGRHCKAIIKLAKQVKAASFLDYGAGQQKLSKALIENENKVFEAMQDYDPAILAISKQPRPADIVACTDVLEHIEPEYLDNVLREISDLTLKVAYLEIATRPANKFLPDGRNAHLIIEDDQWWMKQISKNGEWSSFDVEKIIHANKTPSLRAIVVVAYK